MMKKSQGSTGLTEVGAEVGGLCDNRGMATDHSDAEFRRGIMNMSDAARYLAVSQQTFHRWAKGYEKGQPLLHLAKTVRQREAPVSFISLTEAYVLQALRRAGVQVRKIRPALLVLQREFGTEYALTAPNLATDGIDVLWDYSKTPGGAGLIEPRTGQIVMRTIVADYLTYISRDSGWPSRLQLPSCEPSKVIVDPLYGFGQPRFGVTGARLIDVAAMLKAGEEPDVVADEFGISTHDVGTAARVLLGRAS
jgi:uncharacterized protein (DUF433 family)